MPASRENISRLVRALAMSSPALAFAVFEVASVPFRAEPLLALVMIGTMVVLVATAAVSYLGVRRGETIALANVSPIPSDASVAIEYEAVRPRARNGGRFLLWLVHCIWVAVAAAVLSHLIGQCVPQFAVGRNWPLIAAALVLGFGVSCLPTPSARAAIAINFLVAIPIVLGIAVFCIAAAVHRHHVSTTQTAWTLDSNGTATPYVQDSTPDPSQTLSDPGDPTRTIPDPNATIPKVDAQGNPVWVYDATDGKGNVLENLMGQPIHVPTDANGKLGPLPPGAARAVPELFRISPISSKSPDQYVLDLQGMDGFIHDPQRWSRNYSWALLNLYALSLACIEFLAAMRGPAATIGKGRSVLAILLLLMLLAALAFSARAPSYIAEEFIFSPSSYPTSASSAPIGDMAQIVGAWAFGSANAGWFFMLFITTSVLLVAITSLWMSLAAEDQLGIGERAEMGMEPSRSATRSMWPRKLIRAAILVVVAVGGIYFVALRFPSPVAGGLIDPGIASMARISVRFIPEPLSTIWLIVVLALVGHCIFVCLKYAGGLIFGHQSRRWIKLIVPGVGVGAGAAMIAFFVAAFFLFPLNSLFELIYAIGTCALAGIALVIAKLYGIRTVRSALGKLGQ